MEGNLLTQRLIMQSGIQSDFSAEEKSYCEGVSDTCKLVEKENVAQWLIGRLVKNEISGLENAQSNLVEQRDRKMINSPPHSRPKLFFPREANICGSNSSQVTIFQRT